MGHKITGKILKILPLETGVGKTGKEWKRQNFLLDTGDQYNPEVCFGLFGERNTDMLSSYGEGALIDVDFNISSREYNGKYYHNIEAWKINASVRGGSQPNNQPTNNSDSIPF